MQDRGSQLLQAREYFNDFLRVQEDYDILSTRHFKLYREFVNDRDNFSTISTTDATVRRAEKIAYYKYGKELEQKLQVSLLSYALFRLQFSSSHIHIRKPFRA